MPERSEHKSMPAVALAFFLMRGVFVKRRIDAGKAAKFRFRVNDSGDAFDLASGRSVSKENPLTLCNDRSTHWAKGLAFGIT